MSLLKKKASCAPAVLESAHEKAVRTLRLLTANMIAGDVPMASVLEYYAEPTRENVIIMILRCKRMYEARIQVKRIITLLIILNEQMSLVQGLLERKPPVYNDQEIN